MRGKLLKCLACVVAGFLISACQAVRAPQGDTRSEDASLSREPTYRVTRIVTTKKLVDDRLSTLLILRIHGAAGPAEMAVRVGVDGVYFSRDTRNRYRYEGGYVNVPRGSPEALDMIAALRKALPTLEPVGAHNARLLMEVMEGRRSLYPNDWWTPLNEHKWAPLVGRSRGRRDA